MIKAKTISEIRDEMVDREAIRDCLFRYSHAIDRYQLDILRTVYWPDAIDDHSGFKGNPEGFIAWATEGIKNFENCMHMLGNIFIRLEGSTAKVETYYWSVMTMKTGQPREIVCGGRYLDQFERRGDEWRIKNRVVVHDWFRNYENAPDWKTGMFGDPTLLRGVVGSGDKALAWLGMGQDTPRAAE